MDEKRIGIRTKTFLEGRIEYNGGQASTRCLVRDMSDTGARLTVGGSAPIPERFTLVVPRTNTRSLVRVKWRRNDLLGVFFEEAERAVETGGEGPYSAAYTRALEAEVVKLRRIIDELRDDPAKIHLLLDKAS